MERQRAEDNPRLSAAIAVVVVVLASAVPFASPLLHQEVFSFRDHTDYFVPLRYFTATHLRQGQLPLWNPFNGSGERWLANPQTGIFYPPSWIFLVLPFATAYVLYLWFHIVVLGVGAWFLFSRWCSSMGAMVGAIALMLCGPTLSMLDVSNNLGTFAWFPAAIAVALHRASPEGRVPRTAGAAVIALMFLGAEPFLALVGATLYSIAYLAASTQSLRRRAGELALVGVFSMLLCGAQLLPFVELLKGSDRLSPRGASSLRESIAPRDWLATVVPAPGRSAQPAAELSQQYIPSIYLGVPIVFAAAAAALRARRLDRSRQRVAAGWLVLLVLTIVFAAGKWIPLAAWVWTGLGFDLSRYPARLVPVGALAVAALAATGLDEIAVSTRRWRLLALFGFAVVLGFAVILFTTPGTRFWQLGMSGAWLVVLILLLFLRRAALAATLLVALLVVDLVTAAAPLLSSVPFQRDLEPYRSVVRPPWKLVRLFEYATPPLSAEDRRAWLSGYLNLLVGCFDASTPAPVVPAQYLEIHDRAVTAPRLDLVDFLAVGYLATSRPITHPGYQPVARSSGVTLFRNRTVLPAGQVWTAVRAASSPADAVQQLLNGAKARSALLVSCRPNEACRIPEPASGGEVGAALLRFPSLNRVVAEVETRGPAVLVLTQMDAPGWKVTIDGRAAPPLRANGLFRAVAIPAGRHQIVWSYRPASVMAGAALSAMALLFLAGQLVYVRLTRRRDHG